MATYNSQMFYLGNFADIDVNEADMLAENAADLLGTYNTPVLTNTTVQDNDNDGAVWDDEMGTLPGEDITYDLGSGPVTQFIDSTIVYNAAIKLANGTTQNSLVTVIQMQNGDVFLTDYLNSGTLDGLTLRNIELTSVFDADWGGFVADSDVSGSSVVCFVSGTEIATSQGPRPVEGLKAGDLVITLDAGLQPLVAVISVPIPARPTDFPVAFEPDSLAPGLPRRTLALSPQHRLMCSGPVVARMSDTPEVLIAAKAFDDTGLTYRQRPAPGARYWHLVCADHQVIFAEGYPVETLLVAQMSLSALARTRSGARAAHALKQVDPGRMVMARPGLRMARQRRLVQRITKNHRAILDKTTRLPPQVLPSGCEPLP